MLFFQYGFPNLRSSLHVLTQQRSLAIHYVGLPLIFHLSIETFLSIHSIFITLNTVFITNWLRWLQFNTQFLLLQLINTNIWEKLRRSYYFVSDSITLKLVPQRMCLILTHNLVVINKYINICTASVKCIQLWSEAFRRNDSLILLWLT